MDELAKNIVNETLLNLFKSLLTNNVDFSFIMDNHNNWDQALPERLHSQKKILFTVNKQTLEDSYIENDIVYFITAVGDDTYSKIITADDIHAISFAQDGKPYFQKTFITYPVVEVTKTKKNKEPTEAELSISMNSFKQNNPEMFKD